MGIKIKDYLNKNSFKLLWFLIFLYTAFFSFFSFWKYNKFLYNGIDLAIFNQIFFNTSSGRLFDFSIHPHLYLGDHFTPFILFLVPIYTLFKSSITLLVLQSLSLALIALPTYLIATRVFKGERILPLMFSLLVLFNPILWNINLFDFHILPFAVFFLLFAFYFYQRKKFLLFSASLFLALTVREDVSLIVFMFGFLPFIEKISPNPSLKKRGAIKESFPLWKRGDKGGFLKSIFLDKWIVLPPLIAIAWFFASLKIISFFEPGNNYKFLVYYGWLSEGGGLTGILISFLTHPFKVLLHLFSFGNLGVFFSFLLAFAFLPIFAPLYLILFLGIFLQIFLASQNWGALIFKTHYSSLFLMPLIVSMIYGVKNFLNLRNKKINEWHEISRRKENLKKLFNFRGVILVFIKERNLLILVFVVTILYANLLLGPFTGVIKSLLNRENINRSEVIEKIVDKIPQDASVVSSYRFLDNLSSRVKLYSLHYGFLGKRQFSNDDYVFPDDIDYYILDFSDIITYELQSIGNEAKKEQYSSGDSRLKNYLEGYCVLEAVDDVVLFKKGCKSDLYLWAVGELKGDEKLSHNFGDRIYIINYIKKDGGENFGNYRRVGYSFNWMIAEKININYHFELNIVDKSGKSVWKKLYPLGYGIYPTSRWNEQEKIETNYWFLLPEKYLNDNYYVLLSLLEIKEGYAGLNDIRSVENFIEKTDSLGETFKIF